MLLRTYVKRLRMEASLNELPRPTPTEGFFLIPWDPELLEVHAEVKYRSFRDTLDAAIFPNLGRLDGCLRLMQTIVAHGGFLPGATWLARVPEGHCGCIQGLRTGRRTGMIQNLGVLDDCRGRGFGKALLAAAMQGFSDAGLSAVQLEVSARNGPAVRLYQSAGFEVFKTLYRETKAEYTEYAI
jgi:ribosomal protein S18 acetylase RimI-like enzyme